jgi:hypothetical protein
MFRFYKYDETGYTDFSNSIFSNLDSSLFDRVNDIVIIENTAYRISTVREICKNCNNSENDTQNETTMKRYPLRTITTPGAKGSIPATGDHTDGSWSATDLYNGEVLINTSDHTAYIRSGNEIRSWSLNPLEEQSSVEIEFIDPNNVTIGNPPVDAYVYGNGLDNIIDINHDALSYNVSITDFSVLEPGLISMLIDASEADIGGSSGETLEIPFMTASGETVTGTISIYPQNIPQGDPVIENIEIYSAPFFLPENKPL